MRTRLLSAGFLLLELTIAHSEASPPVSRKILVDGETGSGVSDELIWLGFSPDDRHIAAMGRAKLQVHLYLYLVANGELRKKDRFGCSARELAFGPPAAFDKSGSHLAHLTDVEVRFWPIGAAQPSKPLGLPREWPLPLYGGSASLWAQPTEGAFSIICLRRGKDGVIADLRRDNKSGHSRSKELDLRSVSAIAIDKERIFLARKNEIGEVLTVNVTQRSGDGAFDIKSGEAANTLSSLVVSNNGQLLAGGGEDGMIRVWNIDSKRELWRTHGSFFSVPKLAFSPDGSLLAFFARDSKGANVGVIDAKTGTLLRTWNENKALVRDVCFDALGERLATVSNDRNIRIYLTKGLLKQGR